MSFNPVENRREHETVTMKFEGVVFAISKERERIGFRGEHAVARGKNSKTTRCEKKKRERVNRGSR